MLAITDLYEILRKQEYTRVFQLTRGNCGGNSFGISEIISIGLLVCYKDLFYNYSGECNIVLHGANESCTFM